MGSFDCYGLINCDFYYLTRYFCLLLENITAFIPKYGL